MATPSRLSRFNRSGRANAIPQKEFNRKSVDDAHGCANQD